MSFIIEISFSIIVGSFKGRVRFQDITITWCCSQPVFVHLNLSKRRKNVISRLLILISMYTLVKQELFTFPEHPSSALVCSDVRVARSLVFCVMFCKSLFVPFHLAIVLAVLVLFTDSNNPFGIFKLFINSLPMSRKRIMASHYNSLRIVFFFQINTTY